MELLAPPTNAEDTTNSANMEEIARVELDITGAAIKEYMKKCTQTVLVRSTAMSSACKFGHSDMLKYLLSLYPGTCTPGVLSRMMILAIQSDSPSTCEILAELYKKNNQQVPPNVVKEASNRGNRAIRKLVDPYYNDKLEAENIEKDKQTLKGILS